MGFKGKIDNMSASDAQQLALVKTFVEQTESKFYSSIRMSSLCRHSPSRIPETYAHW